MTDLPYTYEHSFKTDSRTVLFGFVLGVGLTIAIACQHYAWLLGHHPNIGTPILEVSGSTYNFFVGTAIICGIFGIIAALLKKGKIAAFWWTITLALGIVYFQKVYNPIFLFLWLYSYWNIPELSTAHEYLLLFAGGYFFVIQALLMVLFKEGSIKASGAYGTAELQTGKKLKEGTPQTIAEKQGIPVPRFAYTLFSNIGISNWINIYDENQLAEGIILGRDIDENALLRYRGDQHLITVGPTRSGKGAGAIIPNLVTYKNSVIVIDPKGENCNHTWKRRKEDFGQNIICLDPFEVSNYAKVHGSDKFNPMDLIDPNDKEAIDYCNELAASLITSKGQSDSFWTESGRDLVAGIILYVAKAPKYNDPSHAEFQEGKRHLGTVYDLLNQPGDQFWTWLKSISYDNDLPKDVKHSANDMLKLEDSEKLVGSIIKTSEVNLAKMLRSPTMRECMAESTFSPKEVFQEKTTLYIILEHTKMDIFSGWIRGMITSLLDEAIRLQNLGAKADDNRTLFLLDEFGNIGNLKYVKQGYTLLAGYGISFWVFLQDLGQLKKFYPKDWSTFIQNSGIFQVLNTNDLETMRYVSNLAGDTSILVESESENRRAGQTGASHKSGKSKSVSERGRKLLTPDEVRRIDPNRQLIFPANQNPSIVNKTYYFEDEFFDGKYLSRGAVSSAGQLLELTKGYNTVERFTPPNGISTASLGTLMPAGQQQEQALIENVEVEANEGSTDNEPIQSVTEETHATNGQPVDEPEDTGEASDPDTDNQATEAVSTEEDSFDEDIEDDLFG